MSQVKAPQAPTLFTTAPAVQTIGNQFFTFYGLNDPQQNYIQMTYSDGGSSWSKNQLTGGPGILPGAPAPINNSLIKAVVPQNFVYVAYQTSATSISIIRGSGTTEWSLLSALTFTNILNFELYTDHNADSIYVLVNDNNTIKYVNWQSGSWGTPVAVTGANGLYSNLPTPDSNSPLTANFINSQMHIIYTAVSGIIDVYQGGVQNTWYMQTVDEFEGGVQVPLTVKSFLYNNALYVLYIDEEMGTINVLLFNQQIQPNQWKYDYMSENDVPAAAKGGDVAIANGSIFITYPDVSGNLQMVYYFGYTNAWNNTQLTGNGAANGFMPSAPAAANSPVLGVWNGWILHNCYVTTSNPPTINDVFWAWAWQQGQLFPSLP